MLQTWVEQLIVALDPVQVSQAARRRPEGIQDERKQSWLDSRSGRWESKRWRVTGLGKASLKWELKPREGVEEEE